MFSRRAFVEGVLISALAILLTLYHTYPIAFQLARAGRLDGGDGQWSVWVVNWVAHALLTDPGGLFNANIFYPHLRTLSFSEPNIGGGILAIPVYWTTGNPVAAHNSVALASFALSMIAAYYLVRYLTACRPAAIVAAIAFAFSPFAFARTAHIHLMLGAGIPLSLLAMHRLVDRRTVARAVMLGAVLFVQGISCGYYGIFAGLAVAFGLLFFAATRGLWLSGRYWLTVGIAAAVAVLLVLPFLLPLVELQQETGFGRSLEDAAQYSADWRAYLASSAWAHRWMLPLLGRWNEVLFPGFLNTALGATGLIIALRAGAGRVREYMVFYALLGVLALWASFGPGAGLYTILFHSVPVFSFLRAPARMGIVVVLSLAVAAGIGLAELVRRDRRIWRPVAIALSILIAAELTTMPLRWSRAPTIPGVYRMLAELPRGAVAEFPFYWRPFDFRHHSLYMLLSTYHWQPLLNGYSDHIPQDFREIAEPLSRFPTPEAFRILQERQVRYLMFHLNLYGARRRELLGALQAYADYLRPLRLEESMLLYEIVAWPPSAVRTQSEPR